MCVCVFFFFGIHVLNIFIVKRWFWEVNIYRASKLFLITTLTPGGLIEKVHVPSIASQHLVDRSSLISCVWCFCISTPVFVDSQILDTLLDTFRHISTPFDLLRSFCMHCFSHVLHLYFILSSIAFCFITFMHFYGFFVSPWLSLCFLGEAF